MKRAPQHTIERTGWVAFTIGLLIGMALVAAMADGPIRCHEDEVAVWVDTDHSACVALDAMWWDHTTGTVHWFTDDARTP